MNKRRRFKAKRRRALHRGQVQMRKVMMRSLRFHKDAFSMVWPLHPPRFDVIFGEGTIQRGGVVRVIAEGRFVS